jgi:hypothetical protein
MTAQMYASTQPDPRRDRRTELVPQSCSTSAPTGAATARRLVASVSHRQWPAHAGVRHLRVEDGSGRALGRSFHVKLWPTLVFLRDGQEIGPAGASARRRRSDRGLAPASMRPDGCVNFAADDTGRPIRPSL